MEEIILSVLVPTYNHENYIEQALEGIIFQKTSYKYEVLVGDDVSSDNTRNILKKYEEKYPQKIQVIYREHNLSCSNEKLDNHMDLYHRARGKYVIFLEGDDYWIDLYKLDQQIRFLEEHEEYIAVAHNCVVVDQFGNQKQEIYPECREEEYTISHYEKGILPGQLATLMMRNIYKLPDFRTEMWEKRLVPGDRIYCFTLLSKGQIYCMQKAMSAYRHVTSGGSSYSANVKYDFYYDEYWHRELYAFAVETQKEKFVRCAGVLYLDCIAKGIKHKTIAIREIKAYLKKLPNWEVLCLRYCSIYIPIYFRKALYKLLNVGLKRI